MGSGVNLHRPPCCSSPCFSLSLAQGTLLIHNSAKLYKIEHNITPEPFSPMYFHLPPLNELEHILHYFLAFNWAEFLLEEYRYSTKLYNPGRQGNFDSKYALPLHITIITEFRKLHHFHLLCMSIQTTWPFSFHVIKFLFS